GVGERASRARRREPVEVPPRSHLRRVEAGAVRRGAGATEAEEVTMRSGCPKVSHLSSRAAAEAAKRRTEATGVRIYYYECPDCLMWHLTRQQPAVYRQLDELRGKVRRLRQENTLLREIIRSAPNGAEVLAEIDGFR